MKFGLAQLNEILDRIENEQLSYADVVVIGDNSSGKSLFLKKYIEEVRERKAIYYIDAVNRGFNVKLVPKTEKEIIKYDAKILDNRLKEDYFNLKDSFSYMGTTLECVERIYRQYEEMVQRLFFQLTGEHFELIEGDPLGLVKFDNGEGLLSSGFQALIRILLELIFYQDVVIEKGGEDEAWVVIDELDEFLSPKYAGRILEFLKSAFPWGKWLVTTHSCDLVANTSDANVIILENGLCEVIDINDYNSVSEVQIIFERVFGIHAVDDDLTDKDLRRLLNNRMNGMWNQHDERCLEELEHQKLSASQKMIVRQIREW